MQISRERVLNILKHPVTRNALFLYGVQFSSYVFPLITLPFLSRVLNPDGFGLIAFAQSFIWYFVSVTEYGFNLTATRRVAVEQDDPEAVTLTFNSVLAAKALLCVAGFVVMIGITLLVPKLRPDLLLFVLSYLSVVGNLLFPLWLFQGLQKLHHVALRDLATKILALVAIFAFVHKETDATKAVAIQAGALALGGLIGLVAALRLTSVRFAVPPWREVTARLREGAPVFISMAAMTLYGSTNVFLLGLFSNNTEVGHFSGAWRVIVALRMLVAPLVTAIYPHISRVAANSQADGVRFLRRWAMVLSAPFFAGGVVLFVTAPWLVPLLLGPKYHASIRLIQIMAFSPCLCSIANCYATYYMLAFGYDKQWSKIVMGGILVNLAVLLPLFALTEPAQAVAWTSTVLDIYVAAAAYWFYVRTSPAHLNPGPPAVGLTPSVASSRLDTNL
jgi:PST family polysaccharide transporter